MSASISPENSAPLASARVVDDASTVKAADPALAVIAKRLSPASASTEPVSTKPACTPKPSIDAVSEPPKVSATAAANTAEEQAPSKRAVKSDGPRFADLALGATLQRAIESTGYTTPTQIQVKIIPAMLAGRSVLAQSQTGSGKTAAFALPIISRIDVSNRRPQALVLAPTRELAIQVANSFIGYSAGQNGLSVTAIYGGQSYDPQLQKLRRGTHVVVGTPGRVIDHIKRGTLDLSGVETVVLDEADEMLHMGFIDDVQFVLEKTPQQRQVALFSATMPKPIQRIAERHLDDAVHVHIAKTTMTVESVRQRAVVVAGRDKQDALVRFLEIEDTDGVIVFTKTREGSVTVAADLCAAGFSAVALNGDMVQRVRERTIEQLKAGRLDILVATDVAARGLDVKRISHVFNFDLPVDAESYTHRIGRTGRAGRSGEAILFVTPSERRKLANIERTTRQSVEIVTVPGSREINLNRIARFRQRITEAASGATFGQFRTIVTEHVAETGQPIEDVAAALAVLVQGDRSFFATDRPAKKNKSNASQGWVEKDHDRTPRTPRGNRPPRHFDQDYISGEQAVEAGMVRYRIEVGRNHGVKPGNIVGAVANESGLDGKKIGSIKIYEAHSTLDLPDGMPKDTLRTLQRAWVSGQQMKISREGDSGDRGYADRNRGSTGPVAKQRPGKDPQFSRQRSHKPRPISLEDDESYTSKKSTGKFTPGKDRAENPKAYKPPAHKERAAEGAFAESAAAHKKDPKGWRQQAEFGQAANASAKHAPTDSVPAKTPQFGDDSQLTDPGAAKQPVTLRRKANGQVVVKGKVAQKTPASRHHGKSGKKKRPFTKTARTFTAETAGGNQPRARQEYDPSSVSAQPVAPPKVDSAGKPVKKPKKMSARKKARKLEKKMRKKEARKIAAKT